MQLKEQQRPDVDARDDDESMPSLTPGKCHLQSRFYTPVAPWFSPTLLPRVGAHTGA